MAHIATATHKHTQLISVGFSSREPKSLAGSPENKPEHTDNDEDAHSQTFRATEKASGTRGEPPEGALQQTVSVTAHCLVSV